MKSFKINCLHKFKLEDDLLKFGAQKLVKYLKFWEQTYFVLTRMSARFRAFENQTFWAFKSILVNLRIPFILKFKNKTKNLCVELGQDGLRNDFETIFKNLKRF